MNQLNFRPVNRAGTRRGLFPVALCLLLALVIGSDSATAAGKKKAAPPVPPLTEAGNRLNAQYAAMLATLRAEIIQALPGVSEAKKAALQKAREATKAAEQAAQTASISADQAKGIEAKIANWKKFWIGRATKNIAEAQANLNAATTDAARAAAKQDLAKWQANKADGEAKIKEAQADLAKAKAGEQSQVAVNQAAQAALARARANEMSAAQGILADVEPFLAGDQLDAKLVKYTVLTEATPHGLAEFAQQDPAKETLVAKLLADDRLMKEMLIAGGAKFGKYGRAMEIYTAIQQASPKAAEGMFQRLALATSLEHAVPIRQNNAEDDKNASATVDPVKRYLDYEKADLAGELDPAFKNFSVWEYRLVIDCDAPDQILDWGREMLRTYRPDHVYNPNYGWRYSMAVRTEVPYGSQNVANDLPSLNEYQNIPRDGGVCGRRAFFGRFMLRAFGIPTWGVTQHAHAALSHWTPNGWVVNLGAGFNASWWDKDEASRSGTDFLLETQARAHPQDYLKVLRAQWVSRILGEEAYNDRRQIPGGLWSSLAHYEAMVIAAHAVELGPLGQELAEANESLDKMNADQAAVKMADQQVTTGPDGAISISAVMHCKATGPAMILKCFTGGQQMNCSGGFKTQYVFTAPQAGRYALTARVATLQEGQKFLFAANAKPAVEFAVPYTVGLWQTTRPVEVSLVKGQNVLNFEVQAGSRGVAIKQFTLTPAK